MIEIVRSHLAAAADTAYGMGDRKLSNRIRELLRRHVDPRPELEQVKTKWLGQTETKGIVENARSKE